MDKTVKKWFRLKHEWFLVFKNQTNRKICQWWQSTNTGEGSVFIVGVENSSHMQTAMSKPGLINILLANQREVNNNKNELKELNNLCLCSLCTGPNILQYCIYYYTTGLQFMSLVQQSQRKTSSVLERCRLPFDWTDRFLSDWLMMTWLQLIGVCYTNVPSFSQSAKTYICSLQCQNKLQSWQQQGSSSHVETDLSAQTGKQNRDFSGQTWGRAINKWSLKSNWHSDK